MGANFVLQKPISTLNASRCFHAALNFMLKERRRYFRQPVKMPVQVVLEGKDPERDQHEHQRRRYRPDASRGLAQGCDSSPEVLPA